MIVNVVILWEHDAEMMKQCDPHETYEFRPFLSISGKELCSLVRESEKNERLSRHPVR